MIRLIYTGDILPADRDHTPGIGPGSVFQKNKGENWSAFFENYNPTRDILFGNLEAPLVSDNDKRNNIKQSFAGDPEFAAWLKQAGYDVVSIANNHILEHGEDGFINTVKRLRENGIQPAGIHDPVSGTNLVTIEKKGVKIGFAAFNAVHDINNPGLYADLKVETIEKAIAGFKNKVDLICLSFHWGNEYIHIPSYDQVMLARHAIDFGANIIIGHHPHVIQPVEKYNGGWIMYSLGNFIFDMRWSKQVRTGMCVEFEIGEEGIESCKPFAVDIKDDYAPVLNKKCTWFQNTLDEDHRLMTELLEKGEVAYNAWYSKTVKKNRLRARIGMKKQLINQWFFISKNHRRLILKSFFR